MIESCSRAIKFVTLFMIVAAMVGLASCGSDQTNSKKAFRGKLTAAAAATGRTLPPFQKHSAMRATSAVQQAAVSAPTIAPFFGNLTVVTGPQGNGAGMQRQTDCSLLFADFQYTINISQVVIDIDTQIPDYEKVLHNNAFLSTTPDVFAKGCVDQTLGHTSRIGEFLGPGKGGVMIAAAMADGDVYAGAMDAPNDFYNPKKLGADLPPVSMSAGDFNKDQNLDVMSINTDGINSSVDVFLGNGDGTFGAPKVMALPATEVQFGVVDDMDGDGNLDIVLGTGTGGQFQFLVFLGKGDGTFAAPVAYAPGIATLDFFSPFVTADVNGDGFRDIITAAGEVFLGQKSGTNFTVAPRPFPPVTSGTNEYAPGMVAIDFNKDGKVDLAMDDGHTIRIFLGNGDGTFNTGPAYATVGNRGLIVASDLDGDGNVDLFSGFGNSGLYGGDDFLANISYALMGNGDGTFQGAPDLAVNYSGTNLADLNGDGRPDLVGLTGASQNTFQALLTGTNGVPVTGPTLAVPAGVTVDSFAVGDVTGDKVQDLVFVSAAPQVQSFYVAIGKGDGSFQAPTATPVPSLVPSGLDINPIVTGVQLADINHDGKLDLIYSFSDQDGTSQNFTEGFAVQLGNGNGTFGAPVITLNYSSKTAPLFFFENQLSGVVDVTGDTFPDVFLVVPTVITNGEAQAELQEYVGKGDGTFEAPKTLTVTPNMVPKLTTSGSPLTFADLNGDGKMDLIVSGSDPTGSTPTISISLGNGDGTFQAPTLLTFEGFGFVGSTAVADFDGDGKLDIFLNHETEGLGEGILPGNGDGTFQTLPNGDGTVSPPMVVDLSLGQGAVAVDMKNDGTKDVIAGNSLLLNKFAAVPPVLGMTSTAVTSSLNPSTVGANVTFTATVTSATAGTITGTVTFLDGATSLGTGAVGAGGVATLMTSALTAGSHAITAQYGGDANFAASTSPGFTQVVNAAGLIGTTTALTGPATGTPGANLTYTATVTPANGAKVPTGMATFFDGATNIGNGSLNGSGMATFSTSSLAAGMHSITAQYGGDNNFSGSTSNAVATTIGAPAGNFTISVAPTSVNVTAARPGTAVVTVTPTNGFNQAVQFSCTNVPEGIDCEFQPGSVTPNGGPATTMLSVTEEQVNNGARGRKAGIGNWWLGGNHGGTRKPIKLPFAFALGIELMALAGLWRRKQFTSGRGWGTAFAVVLLLTVATFAGGCSGNPGGSSGTTIMVVGTGPGGATATASLNVTIQK